jgi:dienelactone hydrolase
MLRLIFVSLFYISVAFGQQILIPAPSGQYAVGRSTAKLVDTSRTDPYDPDHGNRNVMVSLFYPVERDSCEKTCLGDYLPPATTAYLDVVGSQQYGIPNGTLSAIKLQLCCETYPSANKNINRFPVVLFSPGLGSSRLLYSGIAQNLASNGYTVVTLDSTFESLIVEYPDGTYTTGLDASYWQSNSTENPRLKALLNTRVEDGQFVLTQLGKEDVIKSLLPGAPCALDVKRAGFFGHSFGGATSIIALMQDPRIVGAINIDGFQWGNLTDTYKPALLFGRADPSPHNRTNDASWVTAWDHFKGWRRELGLENSQHLTFMDVPLLYKLAGLPITDAVKQTFGNIDGERAYEVVNTYLRAFFDFAIKGKNSQLFEGPNEAYPEVRLD